MVRLERADIEPLPQLSCSEYANGVPREPRACGGTPRAGDGGQPCPVDSDFTDN